MRIFMHFFVTQHGLSPHGHKILDQRMDPLLVIILVEFSSLPAASNSGGHKTGFGVEP